MKLGYSILLSELLQAEAVEYGDCTSFQVVCPECKEPVFKGKREGVDQAKHYLSHYRKEKGAETDCELRVASYTKKDLEARNAEGQNQRLRIFLEVFEGAVLRRELGFRRPEDKEKAFTLLDNSPGLKLLRSRLRDFHIHTFTPYQPDQIKTYLGECARDMRTGLGAFPVTGFSLDKQMQMATDSFQYLLTEPAKSNFFLLFHVGYLVLSKRLELKLETKRFEPWEKEFSIYMNQLPFADEDDVEDILSDISKVIFPDDSDLLIKMFAELTHEMLSVLLRFPYFETLKAGLNSKA